MKHFTITILVLLFSLSQVNLLSAEAPMVHPDHAFLGVSSNRISKAKAKKLKFDNPYGNYVTEIIKNTAAEKNGVQVFDYLIGFDEQDFSQERSFSHALQDYKAGDEAVLHLIRQGKRMSIPLAFGNRSNADHSKLSQDEEPFFGVGQSHGDKPAETDGVVVNIVDDSAAETMGLESGDIISTINNYPILDWHDLSAAIDMMKPGETINVTYVREGKVEKGSTAIKSYEATHNDDYDTEEEEEEEEMDERVANSVLRELQEEAEDMPEVDMYDVTAEEAAEMKEKVGVDMPIINNLSVEKLNVFPNPNEGVFNLSFDLPVEGPTSIQIYNAQGRLIYQNELLRFSGTFQESIDISENARGTYFLAVIQNGSSVTKKVVIQ